MLIMLGQLGRRIGLITVGVALILTGCSSTNEPESTAIQADDIAPSQLVELVPSEDVPPALQEVLRESLDDAADHSPNIVVLYQSDDERLLFEIRVQGDKAAESFAKREGSIKRQARFDDSEDMSPGDFRVAPACKDFTGPPPATPVVCAWMEADPLDVGSASSSFVEAEPEVSRRQVVDLFYRAGIQVVVWFDAPRNSDLFRVRPSMLHAMDQRIQALAEDLP